tara:strand:+ start:5420 stop:5605 length:186 start_codon:yes stop_codon:yes gene_type:complete
MSKYYLRLTFDGYEEYLIDAKSKEEAEELVRNVEATPTNFVCGNWSVEEIYDTQNKEVKNE